MDGKIKEIMSDILDIDENEINETFGPDDTSTWDSMNNLRLVTALEEEFEVKLKMDDIVQMTDYSKIKEILDSYLMQNPT